MKSLHELTQTPEIKEADPDGSIQRAIAALEKLRTQSTPDKKEQQKKIALEEAFTKECNERNELAIKKATENREFADQIFMDLIIEESYALLNILQQQEHRIDAAILDAIQRDREEYDEEIKKQQATAVDNDKSKISAHTEIPTTVLGIKLLRYLDESIEQLKTQRTADWGADTWEDGIKKNVDTLVNSIKLDQLKSAITWPEGKKLNFDEEIKLGHALTEIKSTVRHTLENRASISTIQDKVAASYKELTAGIVTGADAPIAPPPPPLISYAPTARIIKAKYEVDTEILVAANAKNILQKLGEPLIQAYKKIVNGHEINDNSVIRIGARFAKEIHNELKNFQEKVENFADNTLAIKNLTDMGKQVKNAMTKLANAPRQVIQHLTSSEEEPKEPKQPRKP